MKNTSKEEENKNKRSPGELKIRDEIKTARRKPFDWFSFFANVTDFYRTITFSLFLSRIKSRHTSSSVAVAGCLLTFHNRVQYRSDWICDFISGELESLSTAFKCFETSVFVLLKDLQCRVFAFKYHFIGIWRKMRCKSIKFCFRFMAKYLIDVFG